MSSVRRKQILCFYLFCLQSGHNKYYAFVYLVSCQNRKKMLWFFPTWYPLKNLTQKQKMVSTQQYRSLGFQHIVYTKNFLERKKLVFYILCKFGDLPHWTFYVHNPSHTKTVYYIHNSPFRNPWTTVYKFISWYNPQSFVNFDPYITKVC